MSSRYPPGRDRSPPRYTDRRPSAASTYRGPGDPAGNTAERAPPRGPKAESYRGGFSYGGTARGRGSFAGRPNDLWDRDRDRDARPGPPAHRREDDRPDGWRRDRDLVTAERPNGPSIRDSRPYVGRDRSQRSASPDRPRRGSKESLSGTLARSNDNDSYYGSTARGGALRGRGRGDWDRGRGRNSFVGERDRDLFFPRSRSRDGWREREADRSRGPPSEGDRLERRDYDRTRDSEPRPREHDIWPRERSPGRSSTGNLSTRPLSPAAGPSSAIVDRATKTDYDGSRRPSAVITPSARRDVDQMDYFASRTETPRREVPLSQPYTTPNSIQSASAAALDYGPPPTQPTITTPIAQERQPTTKATPVRTEPEKSPQPFQPPSGPKADRTSSQAQLQKTPQQHETWTKPDAASRFTRPQIIAPVADQEVKALTPASDARSQPINTAERALPSNVPSGPRATSGQFRSRLGSLEPASTFSLLTAPKESPKIASKDLRLTNIPTGPRLDREKDALQARPLPGPASRQWIAPELKPPSKPSIMNPLNKAYQTDLRDRPYIPTGPRQNQTHQLPLHKTRSHEATPGAPHPLDNAGYTSLNPNERARLRSEEDVDMKEVVDSDIAVSTGEDADVNMQDTSDDAEDDDGLDEEDFARAEEAHHRDIRLLEGRRPPPLLQDPIVVDLLFKMTFLQMLASGTPPLVAGQEASSSETGLPVEIPKLGLLSPVRDVKDIEATAEIESPKPRGRPLKEPPVYPIPTPPLDTLPYLTRHKPCFTTFDESDDEVEHEAVTTLIRQEFEQAAFEWQDKVEDLKATYKEHYNRWKGDLFEIDREKEKDRLKHFDEASPAPASPAPSVAPSITSTLQHERTRGGRNTTEADLERAIALSQQTLAEEQERRERETASNALPNLDTEAPVPAPLRASDIELCRFEDANNIVAEEVEIDLQSYVPPEDDFNGEEQAAFINSYCSYPKKWGQIAENVPGRTYQECIIHYYLTKNAVNYKEHLRAKQSKKVRGRKATKPRANALISEVIYNEGTESNTAVVTDSGRPRRAAAPTFGENIAEADILAPLPASKRIAPGLKEKEGNAELTLTPKPRGRKAGTATTKTRKTKSQLSAEQQNGVQHSVISIDDAVKAEKVGARSRGQTLIRPEGAPKPENPMTLGPQRMDLDSMPHFGSSEFSLPMTQSTNPHSSITSYWSVPEQQKFPRLLEYFGHDYASIAEFMKTKSPVMIKNYYARQINEGKTHLEEIADTADNKRQAGEPLGSIPSPVAPPKRRYEATPSAIPARQIMQPVEPTIVKEAEPVQSTNKSTLIDEFPSNSIQRSATGEIVQTPREHQPPTPPLQPALKYEGTPRNERSHLTQKTMPGPRSGLFQEEPYHSPLQRPLLSFHEQLIPQHSSRAAEFRGGEISSHQALGTPLLGRSSLFGHMRDQPEQASQGLQSSQGDRYPPQRTIQPVHVRAGSLVKTSQEVMQDHTQNTDGARSAEPQFRGFFQNTPSTASPGLPPMQQTTLPRADPLLPATTSSTPRDAPKPAPPKRSTVMSLLNDDPPDERPAKRSSIETSYSGRGATPPPSASMPSQRELLNQSRNAMRPDEVLRAVNRAVRPSYPEYPISQSSTPAAAAASNEWIERFDNRPPPASDHRGLHHAAAPSAYSPLSTNSQPAPLPSLQRLQVTDPPRQLDQPRAGDLRLDRHRSLLSGIDHPRLAPSPPPQQAGQQPLIRSASGSSHHIRVPSLGYSTSSLGLSQSQQPPPTQLMRDQGPPSVHPFSNTSTPVSSLHQRSQPSSVDFRSLDQSLANSRLTIQQHMAQEQSRSRDHEPIQPQNPLHRPRELLRHDPDQTHQQQPPQMLHHRPRDSYGGILMPQEHRHAAHNPGIPGQQPQQLPHQNQHQHQHQHQHQQPVSGHSHLPYGQPGTGGRTFTPPLPHHSLYLGQHQQQAQTQQPGPGPGMGSGVSGHYRVLSQNGPGAQNERR